MLLLFLSIVSTSTHRLVLNSQYLGGKRIRHFTLTFVSPFPVFRHSTAQSNCCYDTDQIVRTAHRRRAYPLSVPRSDNHELPSGSPLIVRQTDRVMSNEALVSLSKRKRLGYLDFDYTFLRYYKCIFCCVPQNIPYNSAPSHVPARNKQKNDSRHSLTLVFHALWK
jgi:hypothetical protein